MKTRNKIKNYKTAIVKVGLKLQIYSSAWYCLFYKHHRFILQLDDAAIQVYKDGDFGTYLDLESSLAEQSEEIEGINAR